MTSTMRRSNFFVRAKSRPLSPSCAISTVSPSSRRPFAKKPAVFFLSSISRIRIGPNYRASADGLNNTNGSQISLRLEWLYQRQCGTRMKAPRRTVAIIVGLVVFAMGGGIVLVNPRVTRYVESDQFRAELEKETAKGLH